MDELLSTLLQTLANLSQKKQRGLSMKTLIVGFFLFGSVFLDQAYADILINNCRVSPIYNLEIGRLQTNKTEILKKCIEQTPIDPQNRCRKDYDFVLGVKERGLTSSTQFYNRYDWKNTEIKIYDSGSKVTSAIYAPTPWPFWGTVIPSNMTSDKVTPGSGVRRTYEDYAADDLQNSSEIGPGYSRYYDLFRIHILTSAAQHGAIDIMIFTDVNTNLKIAVAKLNDGFLTFECDIRDLN
jgi:hypothetical protein